MIISTLYKVITSELNVIQNSFYSANYSEDLHWTLFKKCLKGAFIHSWSSLPTDSVLWIHLLAKNLFAIPKSILVALRWSIVDMHRQKIWVTWYTCSKQWLTRCLVSALICKLNVLFAVYLVWHFSYSFHFFGDFIVKIQLSSIKIHQANSCSTVQCSWA